MHENRESVKTILVTGANRGIGLEISRQLDLKGHSVIMGSRNLSKGLYAASKLSEKVVVKQLDVTDEKSIQSLFMFIRSNFKKLDVLINNAGVGDISTNRQNKIISGVKDIIDKNLKPVGKTIRAITPMLRKSGIVPAKTASNVSLEDVKNIMTTNFYGSWRMIQVFLPLILESSNGRIINVSSGSGQLESLTGKYPGYSLSKSALNALTIMLANELKETGIKVNAVCPGWVRTRMGGPNAPRDVSQGADTVIWLATENEIPGGGFFRDRCRIDW